MSPFHLLDGQKQMSARQLFGKPERHETFHGADSHYISQKHGILTLQHGKPHETLYKIQHRTPGFKDGVPDSSQQTSDTGSEVSDTRQPVTLRREVGLFKGVCLTVGIMIGSGIFVSPAGVLSNSGSVGLCLLVWITCGVLTFVGGLTVIELGSMIPKSAGDYMYLKEGLGDVIAFLNLWVSVTALSPSAKAITFLTFAKYSIAAFYPNCQFSHITYSLIACAALSLSAFINCYSVKWVTKVVSFFSVLKVAALLIIICGGVYRLSQGHFSHLATGFEGTATSFGRLPVAFYSCIWAYAGWNQMTEYMEEVKNPLQTLPRTIFISVSLVTGLYLLVNISYLTVISPTEMKNMEVVAVEYGNRVLGPLSFLMPFSVAVSILGSSISSHFSTGRLMYVAAREGHLADILSYIHVHRLTPVPSFIINTVLSTFMIFNSDIFPLISFLSFTDNCFHALVMVSLFVMRYTKKDVYRPYKAPILAAVIRLLVTTCLVVAPIVDDPKKEYVYGLLFIASGFIFYIPFVYYKKTFPGMEKLTIICQQLLKCVPPEFIPD